MKSSRTFTSLSLFTLLAVNTSAQSWLTNGLVAYYPFNGNANDESGSGNDGTNNGATWGVDRYGAPQSSAVFATNRVARIVVPHPNIPVGSSLRTISFWYSPNLPYPCQLAG